MSDPGKAVFLSYASQDAEAARRICEALRAAGIEVWFDQSELRGGDAWDQKIRRQIRECALFVPLITANTNVRPEGYFRLEWKLAVDRSHLLADDHPFLFPIVIGEVPDATARVPDKFRDVQWTRLRLDETPSELAVRVARLLDGTAGHPVGGRGESGTPPRRRHKPAWLRTAWSAVALVLAAYYGLRPLWQHDRPTSAGGDRTAASTAAPAPRSEADRLVRQAQALIDDDPLAVRANYATAKSLGERAIALDPGDAGAYATTARAACMLITFYRDNSPANVAAARAWAESAIRLAPDSVEAGLAVAEVDQLTGGREADVKQRLESLLQRVPDDRRVLRALQDTAIRYDNTAEAEKWIDRALALPGGDPESLNNRADILWGENKYPEMAATLEQSLAAKTTARACHLKLMLLVWGWGDLPAGRAWVEQMPAALLQEDRIADLAYLAWYWSRQPDRALDVLRRFPHPFIEQGQVFLSTGYLAGCAQLLANRPEAATVEFTAGLTAVEDRLAQQPNNLDCLYEKTRLLARLGQDAEVKKTLQILRELAGPRSDWYARRVNILILTGSPDEAIAAAARSIDRSKSRWPIRVNELRYDPIFDPLRADPRFQAVVAQGEAQLAELRAGGSHPPR